MSFPAHPEAPCHLSHHLLLLFVFSFSPRTPRPRFADCMAQGGQFDHAERWWVSAAEAGEASAGANLAAMLHTQPVLGDAAAVVQAVEASASAGELVAMLALGELCKGWPLRLLTQPQHAHDL